jgi:hypothetical protein
MICDRKTTLLTALILNLVVRIKTEAELANGEHRGTRLWLRSTITAQTTSMV